QPCVSQRHPARASDLNLTLRDLLDREAASYAAPTPAWWNRLSSRLDRRLVEFGAPLGQVHPPPPSRQLTKRRTVWRTDCAAFVAVGSLVSRSTNLEMNRPPVELNVTLTIDRGAKLVLM